MPIHPVRAMRIRASLLATLVLLAGAPTGKTTSSPSTGGAPPCQLAGSLQFARFAPMKVFVAA